MFILEYSDLINYSEGPGSNNLSFNLYFEKNNIILEIFTPASAAGLTI